MSPDDLTPSASDAAPEPPQPTEAPAGGTELEPVGYVAGPAPVPVQGRPQRRNLVFGVALVVVAVLAGSALFVSGYSVGREQTLTPGATAQEEQDFKAFWDTYQAIKNQYALGPVDTETLVEGAIKGMVASINDPYSTYLSPADYQASLQDIQGQFTGIGVEVGTVDSKGNTVDCSTFGPDCRFEVTKPLDGSPALAAGIQAGDIITAVDGKSLDGQTPDDARTEIRGDAGTTVTLTIQRGTQAPFDVKITRAQITEQQVVAKDLANGTVGYVQLTGFSDSGADAFIAAVKADVAKGEKKLVIDLRGNPGGFITDAQRVASAFIASGPIFYEQFADGHQQEWDALGGSYAVATDPSIKVVVLVDGGTASAAEIVTGALHDTNRATIIGQKTFGKGTVQEWITLDNQGAVKLTIAKWLTPDKTWIHHIGITPDVTVTVPANTPPTQDPVLDKALSVLGASGSVDTSSVDAAWLDAA
ncbi:MAG TPA: S41 family peptidase [Candidatus Limnocylindrales bacterium]|nr:S41 family peptidase [Candidatus Limnocylindrales bacterium]